MNRMEIIDVSEAARRLGCSTRWVRYLIIAERLVAQRISGVWAIDAASVEAERQRRNVSAPRDG